MIIDSSLAYRKHPENVPEFGLTSWMEDDNRVVKEACGVPGCTECFKDRYVYDDHRIDRQRTIDFIKANRGLLRLINHSENLSDDFKLLLTNRVFGFVLRSRKWYFLNIDLIRPIQRHGEGFSSLILPEGVPQLVEGLVQAHSPHDENTPSTSNGPERERYQVDVVQGKGKGLIILLHGVPGVRITDPLLKKSFRVLKRALRGLNSGEMQRIHNFAAQVMLTRIPSTRLEKPPLPNALLITPANHFFPLRVEISAILLRRSSIILSKIFILHTNGAASCYLMKRTCSFKPETRKTCGVTLLCPSSCASWSTTLAFFSSPLTKWAISMKPSNRAFTSHSTTRLWMRSLPCKSGR